MEHEINTFDKNESKMQKMIVKREKKSDFDGRKAAPYQEHKTSNHYEFLYRENKDLAKILEEEEDG